MNRYYIRPDSDHASWQQYHVVDRQDGAYDRETGARYIASCSDPEMAQRIADLLNASQEGVAAFRKLVQP